MQERWVQSVGWADPLEKEMSTYSSTPAWEIPWREEPGGPLDNKRLGHDLTAKQQQQREDLFSGRDPRASLPELRSQTATYQLG